MAGCGRRGADRWRLRYSEAFSRRCCAVGLCVCACKSRARTLGDPDHLNLPAWELGACDDERRFRHGVFCALGEVVWPKAGRRAAFLRLLHTGRRAREPWIRRSSSRRARAGGGRFWRSLRPDGCDRTDFGLRERTTWSGLFPTRARHGRRLARNQPGDRDLWGFVSTGGWKRRGRLGGPYRGIYRRRPYNRPLCAPRAEELASTWDWAGRQLSPVTMRR